MKSEFSSTRETTRRAPWLDRSANRVALRAHAPQSLKDDCLQTARLLCWRHRRNPKRERIALLGVRNFLEAERRHSGAERLDAHLIAGPESEPERAALGREEREADRE